MKLLQVLGGSKGAQYLYDVKPDISIFGKAMANGFSVACVAGKKIMELGSITNKNKKEFFYYQLLMEQK